MGILFISMIETKTNKKDSGMYDFIAYSGDKIKNI